MSLFDDRLSMFSGQRVCIGFGRKEEIGILSSVNGDYVVIHNVNDIEGEDCLIRTSEVYYICGVPRGTGGVSKEILDRLRQDKAVM
jgi:hypothetical protein